MNMAMNVSAASATSTITYLSHLRFFTFSISSPHITNQFSIVSQVWQKWKF